MEFYERFGFQVVKDNREIEWPNFVGENFNMRSGAQGRAVQLVLADGHDLQTRIDLIEWTEPRWQNENDGRSREECIPRIMALLTSNVGEAYRALCRDGLVPTQALREPDPDTGVKGVVCFEDPDGHIVELIEYVGDQLGSRTDHLVRKPLN